MTQRRLPDGIRLETLKQEAKSLLKSVKAGDKGALDRVTPVFKDSASATLQQIQLVIAREYGFDSWTKLKAHVSQPTKSATLSEDLNETLKTAFQAAGEKRHQHFTIEHCALALADNAVAADVLVNAGCDVDRLRKELDTWIESNVQQLPADSDQEVLPTVGFQRVMQRAVYHIQSAGREEVSAANVLVSVFSEHKCQTVTSLKDQNISRFDLVNYIAHGISKVSGQAPHAESKADQPRLSASAVQRYLRDTTEYLRRVFNEQTPEIDRGMIRIRGVARAPRVRAKVAVESLDPKVNAVSVCVGSNGERVTAVSQALDGELIDVVEWAEDLHQYIANALAPARVETVEIHESVGAATVWVLPDQYDIAIGGDGHNVGLASELCQCLIDVMPI